MGVPAGDMTVPPYQSLPTSAQHRTGTIIKQSVGMNLSKPHISNLNSAFHSI